jgi:hypothetical protein
MMRFGVSAAGVCLLILGSATLARGQQFERPRLTIGASAGVSNPLHGDFQYTAKSWDADVRGQVAPHMMIEAFLSQWRHATETIHTGATFTGPDGVIRRDVQVTIDEGTRVSVFGFSFLSMFTAGRVTVAGGGGPALMGIRRDYAQRYAGCEPAVCRDFENHRRNDTFAVSVVGGVDVRLASRLSVFGQTRAAIPTEDPGSGHIAFTGGVRLVLR